MNVAKVTSSLIESIMSVANFCGTVNFFKYINAYFYIKYFYIKLSIMNSSSCGRDFYTFSLRVVKLTNIVQHQVRFQQIQTKPVVSAIVTSNISAHLKGP